MNAESEQGVFFHVEETDFSLPNEKKIANWVEQCVTQHQKKIGSLNVIFCTDEYLLELNKSHLNHDYYTDIITFDYCEENLVSGDLFISIERVQDNAAKLTLSEEKELHRVIIHGVLHLLGLNDKTEQDKVMMRAKEDELLALLPHK